MSNEIKTILRELNQRPIAYYPAYHKVCKSLHGAVLLSQLMYWFSQKEKIYKTNLELQKELDFTERELKTAKSALKKATFITVSLEGLPAKTYYKIDWEEYIKVLSSLLACDKEIVPTGHDGIVPTIYSKIKETTTETTTKTLSPKSSLSKIPKNKMSEDEGGGDKNFLSFVNRIRKAYVPKPELNIFPPILKIKNGEGKLGAFKIDAKGHLYVSFPGKIQDLSPTEADEYWRFIYANQNQLITHPAKEVTCDISNSG